MSLLAPNWPQPQTHVWGRVKGHGWWPGVVVRANSAEAAQAGPITASDAHSWRHVKFFDNTAAAVHRHDLVPFGEYVSVLANAKKSATYSRALSSARASYEKGVRKGSEDGFDGVCTRESLGLVGSGEGAGSLPGQKGHTQGQTDRQGSSRRDPKREPKSREKSFDLNADLDAGSPGAGPVAGLLRGFGSDGGRLDASNGNLAVDGSNPLGAAGLGEKRPLELVFDDDAVDGSLSGFVPPVGVGDYPTSAGHTTHVQGGGHHKRHKGSAADREGPGHGHANRKLAAVGPDGKPFKRSHKKGQGIKARLAAEAAGLPWPPPKPEGHRARGERAHHVVHGGSYRVTAGAGVKLGRNVKPDSTSPDADPARPGSSPVTTLDLGPDDQLGALSRKLDALQTRVVPLAIAASQHLRRRLQAAETRSAHSGGEAVAVHPTAMMTERERDVLLEGAHAAAAADDGAAGRRGRELLPPHRLRHQRGSTTAGSTAGSLSFIRISGAWTPWVPAQQASVPNLGGEATGFGTLGPMAQMGLNDVELIDADVVGVGATWTSYPTTSPSGLFGMVDTGGMVPMGVNTMVDARMVDEDEEEDGGMLVDGDDMVGEDDALGAMLGREIAREEGARGGGRAGDDGDGDGPMDDAGGPPVAVAVAVDGDGAARTIGGGDDPAVVAVMPLESPMANGAKKSSRFFATATRRMTRTRRTTRTCPRASRRERTRRDETSILFSEDDAIERRRQSSPALPSSPPSGRSSRSAIDGPPAGRGDFVS